MSVLGRGGIPRQRAWLLPLLVAACAAMLGPATATAAPLQWSAPVALDDDGGSAQLSSIACPSSTQCTALDGIGQETTFNPQAPGAFTIHYLEAGAELSDIACPSAGECVAIDGAPGGSQIGHEITFDPADPGAPAAHSIDTAQLVGLACPGANQCVAIDDTGNEVSFNPENLTSPAVTKVKLNASSGASGLDAIGCSSIADCTVVDANGDYYNFNPGTLSSPPAAKGQLSTEALPPIVGMSCPVSLTCVALEGTVSGATEIDFNPTVSTGVATHTLETINEPLGIACADASHCTVIDSTGGGASDELSFDPSTGATTPHAIQPAAAIACPPATSTQCTAAGGGGLVQTFDPQSFSAPAAYDVDPGSPLASVSCAVAAQCTATDGAGHEYTFDPDPRYISGRTVRRITTGGLPLSLVSCPAVEQCTGISGTTEETFDPQLPGTPSSQYFSTATMTGFACPLVSECVAIGDNNAGVEQGVTRFDPAHAGNASTTPIDNSLGEPSGLSCPTASQCTTVSGVDEYTFVPVDGAGRLTAITPEPITTGTEGYTAVSCPSATQCTAIANVPSTGGDAITFDPENPSTVAPTSIDPDNAPTAISCPTTSLCLIVDAAGNAVEVDPTSLAGSLQIPITGAGPLESVYCASAAQCVAVDANGRLFYAGAGGTPPAVIHPPKPKPKAKPPTVSGASLSIRSHGTARLRFTLHQGSHAPRLRAFTIALSGGLSFKGSVKKLHLSGKTRLSHGKLTVTLKRSAARVTVTVGSPPLRAPKGRHRFTVRIVVTDTSGKKTTLTLHFKR
jgi:hypothetical protein